MTFGQLAETILKPELCSSCGACELTCPPGVIGFNGLEPVLLDNSWTDADCGQCGACLDVCPGLDPGTASSEQRIFGRTREPEERWTGIFDEVLAGHAVDPAVYEVSASGGSMTVLLQTALLALGIDVVLCMGRDPAEPWRAAPALVRDPAKLLDRSQSTYQLTPYMGALRTLMLDDPDARVAMTGVACHIQAMRKLQAMDTPAGRWARDHVVLLIEPACSSNTRPEGTAALISDRAGLPLASVERLRYREGEYPGDIEIRTAAETRTVQFSQAVRDFAGSKTYRCLACGDWMSGLADVSVSDGDPNIFSASIEHRQQDKHGRVFVRTAAGAEAVAAATACGIFTHRPVELVGLNLGLERKRNRRAAHEQSGRTIPHGPIPGHFEALPEIIPDERLLAGPEPEAGR
jgi:coenzyme F420 hydrogenase subunit beta